MNKNPRELYGESIFTSFCSVNGSIYGLSEHIERVLSGVNRYYFDNKRCSASLNSYFLPKLKVENLLKNSVNHYFRISFFNESRSEIMPKLFALSDIDMHITVEPYEPNIKEYSLELRASPYSSHYIAIKNGSYFQSFYSRRQAICNGFDDVLFTQDGYVLECSTSNIMFIKGNEVTLVVEQGILAGITQGLLSKHSERLNIKVIHARIHQRDISSFDAVGLLNSVQFIQPVVKINDTSFEPHRVIALRNKFLKVLREAE